MVSVLSQVQKRRPGAVAKEIKEACIYGNNNK